MKCPVCNTKMEKGMLYETEVDWCPKCLGIWLEKDELSKAKDQKDKDLRWLDINLWKERKEFKISRGNKICPEDGVPLYEVRYGSSDIKVDFCNVCEGIWLDRGEFKKIIEYLEKESKKEILHHYLRNLAKEAAEVFIGPEPVKEEMSDFLTVVKLLNYKLLTQYPHLSRIISSLPG